MMVLDGILTWGQTRSRKTQDDLQVPRLLYLECTPLSWRGIVSREDVIKQSASKIEGNGNKNGDLFFVILIAK